MSLLMIQIFSLMSSWHILLLSQSLTLLETVFLVGAIRLKHLEWVVSLWFSNVVIIDEKTPYSCCKNSSLFVNMSALLAHHFMMVFSWSHPLLTLLLSTQLQIGFNISTDFNLANDLGSGAGITPGNNHLNWTQQGTRSDRFSSRIVFQLFLASSFYDAV